MASLAAHFCADILPTREYQYCKCPPLLATSTNQRLCHIKKTQAHSPATRGFESRILFNGLLRVESSRLNPRYTAVIWCFVTTTNTNKTPITRASQAGLNKCKASPEFPPLTLQDYQTLHKTLHLKAKQNHSILAPQPPLPTQHLNISQGLNKDLFIFSLPTGDCLGNDHAFAKLSPLLRKKTASQEHLPAGRQESTKLLPLQNGWPWLCPI